MIECDCGSGKVKDDTGHWWWCSSLKLKKPYLTENGYWSCPCGKSISGIRTPSDGIWKNLRSDREFCAACGAAKPEPSPYFVSADSDEGIGAGWRCPCAKAPSGKDWWWGLTVSNCGKCGTPQPVPF